MGILVIKTDGPNEVTKDELKKWNADVAKVKETFPGCETACFWSHGDEEDILWEKAVGIEEDMTDGGGIGYDEEEDEIYGQ